MLSSLPFKKYFGGSSHCGTAETNLTSIHEDAGLIPGFARWVKDPVLLRLWCRPVARALIRPLVWEPPYAAGAALEKAKRQKKAKVGFFFFFFVFCVFRSTPEVYVGSQARSLIEAVASSLHHSHSHSHARSKPRLQPIP